MSGEQEKIARLGLEIDSTQLVQAGDAAVRKFDDIKKGATSAVAAQTSLQSSMDTVAASTGRAVAPLTAMGQATAQVAGSSTALAGASSRAAASVVQASQQIQQSTTAAGTAATAAAVAQAAATQQAAVASTASATATTTAAAAMTAAAMATAEATGMTGDAAAGAAQTIVDSSGRAVAAFQETAKAAQLAADHVFELDTQRNRYTDYEPRPGDTDIMGPEEQRKAAIDADPLGVAIDDIRKDLQLATKDYNAGKIGVDDYATALDVLNKALRDLRDSGIKPTNDHIKDMNALMKATEFSAVGEITDTLRERLKELQLQLRTGTISGEQYAKGLQDVRAKTMELSNGTRQLSLQEMGGLVEVLRATEPVSQKAARGFGGIERSLIGMALSSINVTGPLRQVLSWLTMMATSLGVLVGVAAAVIALGYAYEKLTEKETLAAKRQTELTAALKSYHEEQRNGVAREQDNLAFLDKRVERLQRIQELQQRSMGATERGSFVAEEGAYNPYTNIKLSKADQKELNDLLAAESYQRDKLREAAERQKAAEVSALTGLLGLHKATAADLARLVELRKQYNRQLAEQSKLQLAQQAYFAVSVGIDPTTLGPPPETPEQRARRAELVRIIKQIDDAFKAAGAPLLAFREEMRALFASMDPTGVLAFEQQMDQLIKKAKEARAPMAELAAAMDAITQQRNQRDAVAAFGTRLDELGQQAATTLSTTELEALAADMYDMWGGITEEQAKALGLEAQMQRVGAAILGILQQRTALMRDENNTAEDLTDAEAIKLALRQKDAALMAEQNRSLVQAARSAISLGQAFGSMTSDTAQVLTNVINIGETLLQAAERAKLAGTAMKLSTGDIIGIASAGVGILGGILGGGPSPQELENRRIAKDNTEALRKLTKVVGELGMNITGSQQVEAQRLVALLRNTAPLRFGGTGINAFNTDRDRLNTFLKGQGSSLKDLKELAELYGITLNTSSGLDELVDSFKRLDEAITATELTRFAETFGGQMQALRAELELFDITDPVKKLQKLLEVMANPEQWVTGADGKRTNTGGQGSQALKDAFKGLDLATAKDRAEAEKRLQDLFRQLQNGTLTAGQLGGLTPQEFLDALLELKRLLKEAGTSTTDPTSQGFAIERTITETTGNRLVGMLISDNIIQREHSEYLRMISESAARGVAALDALTGTAPLDTAGNGTPSVVIEELTINVGAGATPEQAAAAADALVQVVNEKLGVKVRVGRLLQSGDITLRQGK